MTTTTRCQEWMDGLVRATDEVARQALSIPSGCRRLGDTEKLSLQNSGAYVALISPEVQMQIGIAAGRADCRKLAGKLMMMEADDPELTDAVMADAFGEIVNIMAGSLKQVMDARYRGLTLGLPTMIHGHISPTDRQELLVTNVELGEIEGFLVILMNKS